MSFALTAPRYQVFDTDILRTRSTRCRRWGAACLPDGRVEFHLQFPELRWCGAADAGRRPSRSIRVSSIAAESRAAERRVDGATAAELPAVFSNSATRWAKGEPALTAQYLFGQSDKTVTTSRRFRTRDNTADNMTRSSVSVASCSPSGTDPTPRNAVEPSGESAREVKLFALR